MASNKYCVIMAGGIGSRFWPKSRQSMPKQFLDILGTGKSFIRHTYERFAKIVPAGNFLVVTNHKYKDLVLQHIPEIGEKQVLCEPIGRNTAPCIAYAAYTLLRENPDAEMIVTPSDHLILNEDDFRTIIGECLEFADRHDAMLTVGIWSVSALPARQAWQGPATFLLTLVLSAVLGASGFTVPYLEHAIALSVTLFGAMLILAAKPMPKAFGLTLIAVAASLHGLAHGAETPETGFAGYAAGFLLTTAVLHLGGVGIGLSIRRWLSERSTTVLASLGGLLSVAGLVLFSQV